MSPNVESSYADTDAHQLKATTQIHKYTNTESSYADTDAHQLEDTTNTQIHKYTSTQVHRCFGVAKVNEQL